MDGKALVIFSGGQDSTTCLAWALARWPEVQTIGFGYGQRHGIEMYCRGKVLDAMRQLKAEWNNRLGPDWVSEITLFKELGGTSLTEEQEIRLLESGLPNSFVPGRNLFFMLAAAAYAYRQGISDLVLGVCETDFSGYPDCREEAVQAMQAALNIGMNSQFCLHTPLMHRSKAETWALADELGGPAFVKLILEQTHTCYLGERGKRHAWGYGCGDCPACHLRAKGWQDYLTKSNDGLCS